jgi:histidyl-tRNA synthetase
VRGLDYYTHTVFEWVTDDLGAQGTVCAGGRYDGLVERLGGKPTPGAGFAMGLERLILLQQALQDNAADFSGAADVYLCVTDPGQHAWALELADKLRQALPAFRIRTHAGGGKLKNQMKRADQSGARFAVLIGEDEVAAQRPTLKYLREDRPQETLEVVALIERLAAGSAAGGAA